MIIRPGEMKQYKKWLRSRGRGRGPGPGPRALPQFGGGQRPGNGGYQGLDRVLEMLQGGMNQEQFQRMEQGHTGGGGWGAIGGMKGAMSGLSPYATHFLSSLMEKKAAEQQSTEGLEGDALWRTTLMNNLAQQNAEANPQYQLHSGVDEDFLAQIFAGGFGGKSAYEKGFNAEGRVAPQKRPFRPGLRRRIGLPGPNGPRRGTSPPIWGRPAGPLPPRAGR